MHTKVIQPGLIVANDFVKHLKTAFQGGKVGVFMVAEY